MTERKTPSGECDTVPPQKLQWGRSDDGAEDLAESSTWIQWLPLQWGRSDDGAEDKIAASAVTYAKLRFNGAAPMTERKTGRRDLDAGPGDAASMGPLR